MTTRQQKKKEEVGTELKNKKNAVVANSTSFSSSNSSSSSKPRPPHHHLRLTPNNNSVPTPHPPPQPATPIVVNGVVSIGLKERSKENVTVTVRFRPLSQREIRQGEEIAWYADGDTIVRSENTPTTAYAYDRVFGPTTTTRHVYDLAAQHVISGAMEGVNGTIFAYGVTSSGKTHTMHGDQRSPGIIPLAVKDAFSIIQETPSREYLLRVSYLEIYNEVVNDLLNPAGQNLRIREDVQGTFVEGIKEEVVLSPAHALSLIAAGEEHRHVGSTNFNLLSSRSHTIFTLTIESSPCGDNSEEGEVNLSQLNLIDLAGSESSKAETTGVRRKEGSYINKSLLTLGTVISKLTDERTTHVPFRDSKLTRLLQSSLSGHGRVSLICTVTPSSSSGEETHNTLKFAHRAKHIEIQAAQNKIIDEKSLIKKYQNEIRCLKEELEQLKRGIFTVPQVKAGDSDFVLLKQKLEDGQVKLQSRLEEEEDAKAALLGRIQRLTKLILVSTKTSQSSRFSNHPGSRRRHSFGEEELVYLPHKRRDVILDDENIDLYVSLDGNSETLDDVSKDEKKTKKPGLLNWLKLKKRDSLGGLASASEKSSGPKSTPPSTPQKEAESDNFQVESSRHYHSLLADDRHNMEVPDDTFLGQETPSTCTKTMDQIELLREQQKILSGEVALHSSALKRLSEEATKYPKKEHILVKIRKLKEEINGKNEQIASLESQIAKSIRCYDKMGSGETSRSVGELMEQLNEKSFELEVKTADNRITQDHLNHKISECEELQQIISSLKQQLSDALELGNFSLILDPPHLESSNSGEICTVKNQNTFKSSSENLLLQSQEMEELKQKVTELSEAKEQLELRNQKLAEDSSYAKGLASAAAVELKALSEEVSKLMKQNERLTGELAALKNSPTQRRNNTTLRNPRRDSQGRRQEHSSMSADSKREQALSRERELSLSYEAALAEKDQNEAELQRKVEESKQRESYLENELANMWVLVAKLKKAHGAESDISDSSRDSRKIDGFEI